jgi:hypothetical protein
MSNWGMRIGDVLRVRYCYIFDDTGNFKESFTLPKGEQKTGKKNIYYNNEAVMRAIEMYLSQPENCNKCSYDYMFVGESGNGKKVIEDGISIKAPMSKTSATDIILNALEAIGIYPINRKDKSKDVNLDVKLNTHSLRKMFCEFFYITGLKLKCNAELYFDNEVFKLSQDKFMHSKAAITRHYNGAEEKAFRQICLAMNIGLDALENL